MVSFYGNSPPPYICIVFYGMIVPGIFLSLIFTVKHTSMWSEVRSLLFCILLSVYDVVCDDGDVE